MHDRRRARLRRGSGKIARTTPKQRGDHAARALRPQATRNLGKTVEKSKKGLPGATQVPLSVQPLATLESDNKGPKKK